MRRLAAALLIAVLAGCAGQSGDPGGEQSAATQQPAASAPTATRNIETTTPSVLPTAQPTATIPAASPTLAPPTATAATPENPTQVVPPAEQVALPSGFAISVFAQGLDDPRMMALGPDGQIYIAERGAGRIVRLPDHDGDGVADGLEIVAGGLERPSSLAFYRDGSLYVGETTRVLRLSEPDEQGSFTASEVIVDGLPAGGHSTRTVIFSPDWATLFVSVGSSCNVCIEQDARRAAVVAYDPDGSNERLYAVGLRNAVGLAFRPGTSELWATNNGRDHLGDDLPPETVYVVDEGDDMGWPRCHAGDIVDPDFGGADACADVEAPAVEMQAHSAPLGLHFYSGEQFPEEYRQDLFIAFHGSWNRSEPTGYKVVRVDMRDGSPQELEDFAGGWLRSDGSAWGRPVAVLTGADGSLYVSDDHGGVIYRIFYSGESE